MQRREFITLLRRCGGCVAACGAGAAVARCAVIGFLGAGAQPSPMRYRVAAFRQGLTEAGLRRGSEYCHRVSVGPKATTIACRRWRAIWLIDR